MFPKSKLVLLAGGIAVLHLGGCAMMSGTPSTGANVFSLTSSAFGDGTMLEKKNAGNNPKNPNCIGQNVSPPLAWSMQFGFFGLLPAFFLDRKSTRLNSSH